MQDFGSPEHRPSVPEASVASGVRAPQHTHAVDVLLLDRLYEALLRAETLLDATARYMKENPIAAEYSVFYDETTCDGGCLQEDCEIALEEVRLVLTQSGLVPTPDQA